MLAGVDLVRDRKDAEQPSTSVWSLMTSFKINLDQERSLLLREESSLKTHITQLSASLSLLQDLKRKVDAGHR